MISRLSGDKGSRSGVGCLDPGTSDINKTGPLAKRTSGLETIVRTRVGIETVRRETAFAGGRLLGGDCAGDAANQKNRSLTGLLNLSANGRNLLVP